MNPSKNLGSNPWKNLVGKLETKQRKNKELQNERHKEFQKQFREKSLKEILIGFRKKESLKKEMNLQKYLSKNPGSILRRNSLMNPAGILDEICRGISKRDPGLINEKILGKSILESLEECLIPVRILEDLDISEIVREIILQKISGIIPREISV